MQKYRDSGTGGGGGHGRPTFSMDNNPAYLRGIAPVLSPPPHFKTGSAVAVIHIQIILKISVI
jgi:hypothetical protein